MIRGAAICNNIKQSAIRHFVSSARVQTQFTTLSNGVTIASESDSEAPHATIGLYYGAGSRSDHLYNNGVAALTTNILASNSQNGILLKGENKREHNGIVAQSTNENVIEAGKLIGEIASNSTAILEKANYAAAKASLAVQADAKENNPSKKVLQHLKATAFQGYSLGLPELGTSETIQNLEAQDSQRFLDKHLVGSNVVIAASGRLEHDQLVEAIEGSFNIPQGAKVEPKVASFLGSEVRMRDDTLPKAYVSIGVQGESIASPAFYIAKVAAEIYGSYDVNSTFSKFTSPKLASIVQEYNIVDKYYHFSKSYSDTGLWGFNCEISEIGSVDEFVHFALKEWNRLSISITDAEVARGKAAAKTALLKKLSSPDAVASDIASNVLNLGYRNSVKQALQKIDEIDTKAVKAWAEATLWDKDIVISGTGQIEDLLDYNRWRNEMAMMRW